MKPSESHPLDEHIGICLRRLRNINKYSLEHVAEWLNICKQQVSRFEHGQSRMNTVQLYQLARGFNVPISWFFDDFKDEADEIKWIGNMVREDRSQWLVSNQHDQTQKLLALWAMVDNQKLQVRVINLLEAVVEM